MTSRRRYAADLVELGRLCPHRHLTIAAAVRCAGTRSHVVRAANVDERGRVREWCHLTMKEITAWGRAIEARRRGLNPR